MNRGLPADVFCDAVDEVLANGSPGANAIVAAADKFLGETLRGAIAAGVIDEVQAEAIYTIGTGPPLD